MPEPPAVDRIELRRTSQAHSTLFRDPRRHTNVHNSGGPTSRGSDIHLHIPPHDGCDEIGSNPRLGLVGSLNRPGGNVTGVSLLSWPLTPKRLNQHRELVPTAAVIGCWSTRTQRMPRSNRENPDSSAHHRPANPSLEHATLTQPLRPWLNMGLAQLVIGEDAFFDSRCDLAVELAAQHAVPTIYPFAARRGFPLELHEK